MVALPFAVLVFTVLRWRSAGPVWAAIAAAIVTMIAFVAAVNAAVYIDGQMAGAAKAMRSVFAGLALPAFLTLPPSMRLDNHR